MMAKSKVDYQTESVQIFFIFLALIMTLDIISNVEVKQTKLIIDYELQIAEIKYKNHLDNCKEHKCETFEMYNVKNDYGINGIYRYEDKFYCLWIKNRTLAEEKQTECHEISHNFAEEKYDHFCLDDYLINKNQVNLTRACNNISNSKV